MIGDVLGTVGMLLWTVPLVALGAVLGLGAVRDLFRNPDRGR